MLLSSTVVAISTDVGITGYGEVISCHQPDLSMTYKIRYFISCQIRYIFHMKDLISDLIFHLTEKIYLVIISYEKRPYQAGCSLSKEIRPYQIQCFSLEDIVSYHLVASWYQISCLAFFLLIVFPLIVTVRIFILCSYPHLPQPPSSSITIKVIQPMLLSCSLVWSSHACKVARPERCRGVKWNAIQVYPHPHPHPRCKVFNIIFKKGSCVSSIMPSKCILIILIAKFSICASYKLSQLLGVTNGMPSKNPHPHYVW